MRACRSWQEASLLGRSTAGQCQQAPGKRAGQGGDGAPALGGREAQRKAAQALAGCPAKVTQKQRRLPCAALQHRGQR